MAAPGPDPSSERRARWLLLPLVLGVLLLLPFAPRLSSGGVDDFTTLEMIRGIAQRGFPATVNVPGWHLPELQARWMNQRGDLQWGKYPPLYPYLMLPLFIVGGTWAVLGSSIVFLLFAALGTFWLGRRMSADPWVGTVAAYITLTSGLVWGRGFMIAPFSLVIAALTFMLCAAAAGIEAASEPGGQRRAAACGWLAGLLGGVAAGSHLLAVPMALAAGAALLLGRSPTGPRAPIVVSLAPWFAAGLGVPLLLVAFINHRRFGSWDPVTYGPCIWDACRSEDLIRETAGASLRFAAPALLWLSATGLGLVLALRRQRSHVPVALVLAVSLFLLLPSTLLRERVLRMGQALWYFLLNINAGGLDPQYPLAPAPDGLGVMMDGSLVRSALQTTPILALALGVRIPAGPRRPLALLLILPTLAGLLMLALRANLPVFHMLGATRQVMRYAAPVVPPLAVLSAAALRDLPWKRWHLWGGALLFLAVALYLLLGDEWTYARRWLLLYGTLAGAGAGLFCRLLFCHLASPLWGRGAALFATLALVLGASAGTALDLRQILERRLEDDRQVAALAALAPARFALVGATSTGMAVQLSLRATRDMEYVDLTEARDCQGLRRLIQHWTQTGRPIYYASRQLIGRECLPPGAHWQQMAPGYPLARLIFSPATR